MTWTRKGAEGSFVSFFFPASTTSGVMAENEYELVVDDTDYDIFDYVGWRTGVPNVDAIPGTCRTIYVDRRRFDADVAVGQEKMITAYAQFHKDVHRCRFFMNGRLTRRLPSQLPVQLLRYCTQAVMGLPLEVMHCSEYIVAEMSDKQPMNIFASDRDVVVVKRLQFAHHTSMHAWRSLEITVRVKLFDPTALMSFRFDITDPSESRFARPPNRQRRLSNLDAMASVAETVVAS